MYACMPRCMLTRPVLPHSLDTDLLCHYLSVLTRQDSWPKAKKGPGVRKAQEEEQLKTRIGWDCLPRLGYAAKTARENTK